MTTRLTIVLSGLLLLLAGPAAGGPLDVPGAAKAVTCSACHGFAGNSASNSMPILAGMSPKWFRQAIQDYAAGKRTSPEMEPYAKMTVQLGLEEIAGYFAGQKMQPTPVKADASAVTRGKAAAAACAACHGADGRGTASQTAPSLAGQPPGYLSSQMQLFKQGVRTIPDPAKAMMRAIPDQTFEDLAAYYSAVR